MAVKKVIKNGRPKYRISYYDCDEQGHYTIRKWKFCDSKSEADTFHAQKQLERQEKKKKADQEQRLVEHFGILVPKHVVERTEERKTVQGLAMQYFESAKFLSTRPSSQTTNKRRILSFVEWCTMMGYIYVDQCTKDVAMQYEAYVIKNWKSKGREARLIAASALFNFELLHHFPVITVNPFIVVNKTGHFVRKRPRYIKREELEALYSFMSPKWYHSFDLLYQTGMRSGEARHAEWAQVDWQNMTLDLGTREDWKPKEEGLNTVIALTPLAIKHLEFFYELTGDKKYILGDGVRPVSHTYFWKQLKKYKAMAKVKFPNLNLTGINVHSFRKTFVTEILKAGGTISQAAFLARHKDEKTTRVFYGQLELEDVRSLINQLPPVKVVTNLVTKNHIIAQNAMDSQKIN